MPQAVVMRRYGGPEVLTVEDVALAPLKPDEIRVRAVVSAVNHSDLEIEANPTQQQYCCRATR